MIKSVWFTKTIDNLKNIHVDYLTVWGQLDLQGNSIINSVINLTYNTLSFTKSQIDTSLTDDNFLFVNEAQSLLSKTFNLSNNTLTGNLAQFNTALSDADFCSLLGTEEIRNKTIDGNYNTISNISSGSLSGFTKSQLDTLITDDNGVYVGSNNSLTGTLTLTNSTNSTTKDDGALVLSNGGMGVEGNVNIGGNITSTNITAAAIECVGLTNVGVFSQTGLVDLTGILLADGVSGSMTYTTMTFGGTNLNLGTLVDPMEYITGFGTEFAMTYADFTFVGNFDMTGFTTLNGGLTINDVDTHITLNNPTSLTGFMMEVDTSGNFNLQEVSVPSNINVLSVGSDMTIYKDTLFSSSNITANNGDLTLKKAGVEKVKYDYSNDNLATDDIDVLFRNGGDNKFQYDTSADTLYLDDTDLDVRTSSGTSRWKFDRFNTIVQENCGIVHKVRYSALASETFLESDYILVLNGLASAVYIDATTLHDGQEGIIIDKTASSTTIFGSPDIDGLVSYTSNNIGDRIRFLVVDGSIITI